MGVFTVGKICLDESDKTLNAKEKLSFVVIRLAPFLFFINDRKISFCCVENFKICPISPFRIQEKENKNWQKRLNNTGAINDPLGQIHSHASSEHYILLFCYSRFEKWGRPYGTTCAKTMIPTGRYFGLAKWINSWALQFF